MRRMASLADGQAAPARVCLRQGEAFDAQASFPGKGSSASGVITTLSSKLAGRAAARGSLAAGFCVRIRVHLKKRRAFGHGC